MEEYTLAKDIFGERTPSQSICGEGFSPHEIRSPLLILCSDLSMGKGKWKVYINEEILIVSSKTWKGCGSTRSRGRQIKKEFVLRDSKEENGDDERVEKDEGRKTWVPIDVETLISILERWMRISWKMLENKVNWNSDYFNFNFLFQFFGLGLIFISIYLTNLSFDLNFNSISIF